MPVPTPAQLAQPARTVADDWTITVSGDTFSYDEATWVDVAAMGGRRPAHTDRDVVHRVD